MKKSSKIWKIEKLKLNVCSGMSYEYYLHNQYRVVSCQLIYETELDCVLDIATDVSNNGLKVYKHQSLIKEEFDLNTEEYYPIEIVDHPNDIKQLCFGKTVLILSKEDLEKETREYKHLYDGIPIKVSEKTHYHWVEVFMQ